MNKKRKFEVSNRSFISMSNKFLILFFTWPGFLIGLHQILPKGFIYYLFNWYKHLFINIILMLPVSLLIFFIDDFALLQLLIVTPIMGKLVFDCYRILFNLEKDDDGKNFIFFPSLLNIHQKNSYSKALEKFQNQKDEEKKLQNAINVRKVSVLQRANSNFSNFKKNFPKKGKIHTIQFPYKNSPKISLIDVFISNDHLVFCPYSVDDDFKEKHLKEIDDGLKNDPNYEFSFSKNYEKPYFAIAINNIISYSIHGSISHVAKVEGGGSSLSGAILGGLVAGDAGSIIGSRKVIKSKIEQVDSREVKLLYLESNKQKIKSFKGSVIEAFEGLIPEKYKD